MRMNDQLAAVSLLSCQRNFYSVLWYIRVLLGYAYVGVSSVNILHYSVSTRNYRRIFVHNNFSPKIIAGLM